MSSYPKNVFVCWQYFFPLFFQLDFTVCFLNKKLNMHSYELCFQWMIVTVFMKGFVFKLLLTVLMEADKVGMDWEKDTKVNKAIHTNEDREIIVYSDRK